MHVTLFKALALLLLSTTCFAQDDQVTRYFEYGIERMREGNYAEAYCYLRPLADRGHEQSQYTLGWMYHNGYGLRIDDEKAFEWWNRAAGSGNRDALFALGLLYEQGLGTKKDLAKAADMYIQAATRGSEDALSLIQSLVKEPSSPLRPPLLAELRSNWTLLSNKAWIINTEKANVRKGPGTKYSILFVLEQGQKIYELDSSGKWLQIGVEGEAKTGWLHKSLLREAGTEKS